MDKEQQHENILRLINELSDYAFLFIDKDGNIQTWNNGAKNIKGYSSDEILGKNFRIFYTEEDRRNNRPEKLLEVALKNGKVYDESWRVRKDGTKFWAGVTITSVHDDKGEIVGFGKLTRDLTERKLAEEQLRIKNKELEQFNYIASHDLQEPLRTVANYIQILEEDYSDRLPDEVKNHLKTISRATERMRKLVRSLLDFSRLGKNKKVVSVDCKLLIGDLISDLNAIIESTQTKIICNGLPTLNGYETELRQLFLNLIVNAIKFRKKNVSPVIEISSSDKSEYTEFWVSDNGIGIEEKHFKKIFNIFQRLNPESSYEGYGIGLANCKKIVEIHGGSLWVESELGKGTVFKFTLKKNLA